MEVYVVHVAPRKGIRCVVKSWLHQPSNARLQLTLLFQINRVHSSREGSKSKQRSRDKCTSAVVWQRLFNASHRTTQATTLTLGKQATFLSSRSAKAHSELPLLAWPGNVHHSCYIALSTSKQPRPIPSKSHPTPPPSSYTYTLHQNYHITHQLLQQTHSSPHTTHAYPYPYSFLPTRHRLSPVLARTSTRRHYNHQLHPLLLLLLHQTFRDP